VTSPSERLDNVFEDSRNDTTAFQFSSEQLIDAERESRPDTNELVLGFYTQPSEIIRSKTE